MVGLNNMTKENNIKRKEVGARNSLAHKEPAKTSRIAKKAKNNKIFEHFSKQADIIKNNDKSKDKRTKERPIIIWL